ncbi:hypothetical protein ACLOJK_040299 [Asimina triloba]
MGTPVQQRPRNIAPAASEYQICSGSIAHSHAISVGGVSSAAGGAHFPLLPCGMRACPVDKISPPPHSESACPRQRISSMIYFEKYKRLYHAHHPFSKAIYCKSTRGLELVKKERPPLVRRKAVGHPPTNTLESLLIIPKDSDCTRALDSNLALKTISSPFLAGSAPLDSTVQKGKGKEEIRRKAAAENLIHRPISSCHLFLRRRSAHISPVLILVSGQIQLAELEIGAIYLLGSFLGEGN